MTWSISFFTCRRVLIRSGLYVRISQTLTKSTRGVLLIKEKGNVDIYYDRFIPAYMRTIRHRCPGIKMECVDNTMFSFYMFVHGYGCFLWDCHRFVNCIVFRQGEEYETFNWVYCGNCCYVFSSHCTDRNGGCIPCNLYSSPFSCWIIDRGYRYRLTFSHVPQNKSQQRPEIKNHALADHFKSILCPVRIASR